MAIGYGCAISFSGGGVESQGPILLSLLVGGVCVVRSTWSCTLFVLVM